jgi:hypothetical protein
MECVYCKKIYSTTSSLSHHQKTTKSCLAIQKQNGNNVEHKIYQCTHCKKEVTSTFRLEQHMERCKVKKRQEQRESEKKVKTILEQKEDECEQLASDLRHKTEEFEYELRRKDERIKELENRLFEQPKSITNINKTINNTNNITIYEVMSPESVKEFFKTHYNLETLLGGQKALAQFICDGFIRQKQVYYCTDRARHKFVIEDESGKQIEDTNCDQLVGLTSSGFPHVTDVYEEALFNKHEDVTEDDIQSNYRKITNLDKDRSEFTSEMSRITPSIREEPTELYQQALEAIKRMKDAIKPYESNEKSNKDNYQEPIRNEIGGFSLGKLDTYRKAYRERKAVMGEDAEIKAPRSLMEQFKDNPSLEQKYIDFITS